MLLPAGLRLPAGLLEPGLLPPALLPAAPVPLPGGLPLLAASPAAPPAAPDDCCSASGVGLGAGTTSSGAEVSHPISSQSVNRWPSSASSPYSRLASSIRVACNGTSLHRYLLHTQHLHGKESRPSLIDNN